MRVRFFGKSGLWLAARQPPDVCVLTPVLPRVDLSTCLNRSSAADLCCLCWHMHCTLAATVLRTFYPLRECIVEMVLNWVLCACAPIFGLGHVSLCVCVLTCVCRLGY